MNILAGTSGWYYSHWKTTFYNGIPQKDWLKFYAKHLSTVEINATFYHTPKESTLRKWFNETPDDFKFSLKAPRYITHILRLKNCEESLQLFFNRISILKNKCDVILFQLPPSFKKNVYILQEFIGLLPDTYRYTFEFRNPTWWTDDVMQILKANNIAFCVFQLASLISPRVVTADFIYVRLHGPQKRYVGRYNNKELSDWRDWIEHQHVDAYVYFDNTDYRDYAIKNAIKLKA